eukprot:g34541.t1
MRERVTPIRDQVGNLCVKLQDIGKVLNEYFSPVFTLEKENVVTEFRKKNCEKLAQFDIGNGKRRLREDMIEVYKTMRGMDRVNKEQLFPLAEGSITRGHSFR